MVSRVQKPDTQEARNRRSLLAAGAVLGAAALGVTKCMYPVDATGFLPKAFGIKRVIYNCGWGGYLFLYELDLRTLDAIRKLGLAFFSYDPTPRRKVFLGPGLGGVTWFETPIPPTHKTGGDRPVGYEVGTNGNTLPKRAKEVYQKVRQAAVLPGNFYATDESKTFAAVDVTSGLLLFVRADT